MSTPIPVADPQTFEWFQARSTGIGASHAGAACGLNKYGGPLEVYQIVRGEHVVEETKAMRRGKHMEPAIRGMYQDEFNVTVTHGLPMYRHAEWEFMLATPDAEEVAGEVGVEFKDMNFNVFRSVDELGLIEAAPHYALQCHQQMAVMNWQMVKLVIYADSELHVYEIERDEGIIEMIAEKESALWARIIDGDPPEATQPSDLQLLKRLGVNQEPVVPLTVTATDRWSKYESIGKVIRYLNGRRDLLKAQVLQEIGERPGGLLSDGRRVVRRKMVERKGYTVAACQMLDIRAVKYANQSIESNVPLGSPG